MATLGGSKCGPVIWWSVSASEAILFSAAELLVFIASHGIEKRGPVSLAPGQFPLLAVPRFFVHYAIKGLNSFDIVKCNAKQKENGPVFENVKVILLSIWLLKKFTTG